jgi:hypothetical protein
MHRRITPWFDPTHSNHVKSTAESDLHPEPNILKQFNLSIDALRKPFGKRTASLRIERLRNGQRRVKTNQRRN